MSAAGRIVLYMLSIFIVASMMPSQTVLDVAGPRQLERIPLDLNQKSYRGFP
jgi:hypothetical protein